jgi:glycosyltransferase involved in cell wall biosynthesis
MAKGKYIAFVDSDDYIDPEFLKVLYDMCETDLSEIAECDYICVKEYVGYMLPMRGQYNCKNSNEILHELCCIPNSTQHVVTWNKLYRRELFENIRFLEGKLHEDEFTTYKLIYNAKKISITNKYLYYYLKREGSITSSKSNKRLYDALEAINERCEFMRTHGFEEEYIASKETATYLYNQINNITDAAEKFTDKIAITLKKEDRIIIYGVGQSGKALFERLIQEHFSDIVLVDNRWYTPELRKMNVKPLNYLKDCEADIVVVAIKNIEIQNQIVDMLVDWGIKRDNIRIPTYS